MCPHAQSVYGVLSISGRLQALQALQASMLAADPHPQPTVVRFPFHFCSLYFQHFDLVLLCNLSFFIVPV